MDASTLTDRQLKAIPYIVAAPTYTEGAQTAGINRATLYEWLRDPDFKAELDMQREQVSQEAFGVLTQNLTRAVEALTGLLDGGDARLKRLVCNDIISHFLKHKELAELEERIEAVEDALAERE